MLYTSVKNKIDWVFIKKKNLVIFCSYTDNSNNGLTYPYKFLYMIIILTCRKIYFHLYTIGKKKFL